jgi:hypothetical protein
MVVFNGGLSAQSVKFAADSQERKPGQERTPSPGGSRNPNASRSNSPDSVTLSGKNQEPKVVDQTSYHQFPAGFREILGNEPGKPFAKELNEQQFNFLKNSHEFFKNKFKDFKAVDFDKQSVVLLFPRYTSPTTPGKIEAGDISHTQDGIKLGFKRSTGGFGGMSPSWPWLLVVLDKKLDKGTKIQYDRQPENLPS